MQENELPEWAKRVQQERNELEEKKNRLLKFLVDPSVVQKVGALHFQLLDAQLDAMNAYLKILDARLMLEPFKP